MSETFIVTSSRLFELAQEFQNQGSGWQFEKVESLDINIDPFEPLSGSSYIPLPKKLADKKAIINVKDPQRLNEKMREDSETFKWKGINFPVSLKQIDKFENRIQSF